MNGTIHSHDTQSEPKIPLTTSSFRQTQLWTNKRTRNTTKGKPNSADVGLLLSHWSHEWDDSVSRHSTSASIYIFICIPFKFGNMWLDGKRGPLELHLNWLFLPWSHCGFYAYFSLFWLALCLYTVHSFGDISSCLENETIHIPCVSRANMVYNGFSIDHF